MRCGFRSGFLVSDKNCLALLQHLKHLRDDACKSGNGGELIERPAASHSVSCAGFTLSVFNF